MTKYPSMIRRPQMATNFSISDKSHKISNFTRIVYKQFGHNFPFSLDTPKCKPNSSPTRETLSMPQQAEKWSPGRYDIHRQGGIKDKLIMASMAAHTFSYLYWNMNFSGNDQGIIVNCSLVKKMCLGLQSTMPTNTRTTRVFVENDQWPKDIRCQLPEGFVQKVIFSQEKLSDCKKGGYNNMR